MTTAKLTLTDEAKKLELIEARWVIVLTDPPKTLEVSEKAKQLIGFAANEFLSGHVELKTLIHPHDQDIADWLFSNEITTIPKTFNFRLRHADGRIRCVKGQASKVIDTKTDRVILDLFLQDAKSLWQHNNEIFSVMFRAMMDKTNDFIYFKDRNHVFTGASQTLVTLTEPSEHWTDLLGVTDYDVFPEEYADIYYSLEKQVFAGKSVAHEVQKMIDNAGNEGWVDNRKGPITNDDNEIIGLFGIARDVTELKRVEAELMKMAQTDHLTGLANHRSFIEKADAEVSRSIRYEKPLSVAMIDIDFFKRINDTFGHQAGDVVLKTLSALCRKMLREVDILGRLGGEEFGIVFPETALNEAVDVAERLRQMIAATEILVKDDLKLNIAVSIGVATLSDKETTFSALLNQADQAMYEAKRMGRNKVYVSPSKSK